MVMKFKTEIENLEINFSINNNGEIFGYIKESLSFGDSIEYTLRYNNNFNTGVIFSSLNDENGSIMISHGMVDEKIRLVDRFFIKNYRKNEIIMLTFNENGDCEIEYLTTKYIFTHRSNMIKSARNQFATLMAVVNLSKRESRTITDYCYIHQEYINNEFCCKMDSEENLFINFQGESIIIKKDWYIKYISGMDNVVLSIMSGNYNHQMYVYSLEEISPCLSLNVYRNNNDAQEVFHKIAKYLKRNTHKEKGG